MTTDTSSGNHRERRERLTVGTRYQAFERLTAELNRSSNDNGYQFSILMIEFQGLSESANCLGEAVENDPLQTVTSVLTQDLGRQDLCCQLRSDEFLLILPAKGAAECRDVAERLARRWDPAASTRGAAMEVSIGFASSPVQGSTTIEQLLAAADETMHNAKPEMALVRESAAIGFRPELHEQGPGPRRVFADRAAVAA